MHVFDYLFFVLHDTVLNKILNSAGDYRLSKVSFSDGYINIYIFDYILYINYIFSECNVQIVKSAKVSRQNLFYKSQNRREQRQINKLARVFIRC